MDNTCVCCGTVIPEGRIICPVCLHNNAFAYSDDIHKRKTGLWEFIKILDRRIRNWSIRVFIK